MRRLTTAMLLALALTLTAAPSRGDLGPVSEECEYDDSQSHPLRVAAYLAHPLGYSLEWLVFRPFHRLVSQSSLEAIFGHRPHRDDASIGTR